MEARVSTSPGNLWDRLIDAARFWEPLRLVYNFILSAAAVVWLVATWPHFRNVPMPSSLLPLAVLALLANVCYSAAYVVDIPLQRSSMNAQWRGRRRLLFLLGTIFAVLLENYWVADEIYPSIR